MRFRMLGPLDITADDGSTVPVSRPLHRSALAYLLVNAGQPCSVPQLIAELWGDAPPLSPEVSLRSCVYGVRKLLPDAGRLRTHPSGYLIEVAPGELDLHDFLDMASQGRDALDQGDPHRAAALLAEALGLWREPPLADLPAGKMTARLLDQHKEIRDALFDALLALGRHRQVVAELRSAVAAEPLREHAWAQLMIALYRCGARAEALAAFGKLRIILVSTYGIEPGPELQELHRRVLADDPALTLRSESGDAPAAIVEVGAADGAMVGATQAGDPGGPVRAAAKGAAGAGPAGMPRAAAEGAARAGPAADRRAWLSVCQLPPSVPDFTGRATEITQLLDRLAGEGMTITVISGMPGIGKTALAVHAAHLARQEFGDGQLLACLDDSGRPRDPHVVLGELLRGQGVPAGQIPDGRFEREARYRSVLAGRRVLVLADGATTAAQVRPLLPGTVESAVVVTSRARLADLDGARLVELSGLLPADSVSLLEKISDRTLRGDELDAARAIAAICGQLPLAVRIAGARLSDDPQLTFVALADQLRDESRLLDELAVGDQSVRLRLADAVRVVSATARRVLSLLAVAGPRDFSGSLIDMLLEDPGGHLIAPALAEAGLLRRVIGSTKDTPSYRMHPLVRAYASQLLIEAEPGMVGSATGRLLASDWLELADGYTSSPATAPGHGEFTRASGTAASPCPDDLGSH